MGLPLAKGGASYQFCQLPRHHTLCNEKYDEGQISSIGQSILKEYIILLQNSQMQNNQANFCATTTLLTHGSS